MTPEALMQQASRCMAHDDMVALAAGNKVLSEQVLDRVDHLGILVESLLQGEISPQALHHRIGAVERQMEGFGAAMAKQAEAMKALSDNQAVTSIVLQDLKKQQEGRFSRGTSILVAVVGLGGPIIAGAALLLKG